MDISNFEHLIDALGFPIVCCGVLMWYIYRQAKMHRDEVSALTDAINNNTVVMEKIVNKLGGE